MPSRKNRRLQQRKRANQPQQVPSPIILPASETPFADSLAGTAQQNSAEDTKMSDKNWHKLTPDWAIVILTVVIGIISYLQWTTAQDAIYVSNRAYLTAKKIQIFEVDTEHPIQIFGVRPTAPTKTVESGLPKYTYFKVDIENSGNSPAENVIGKMVAGAFDNPFQYRKKDDEIPVNQTFMADPRDWGLATVAKDSFASWSEPIGQEISGDLEKAIDTGKKYVLAYGTIRYTDIMKRHRITTFCFIYRPADGLMHPCVEHNEIQ